MTISDIVNLIRLALYFLEQAVRHPALVKRLGRGLARGSAVLVGSVVIFLGIAFLIATPLGVVQGVQSSSVHNPLTLGVAAMATGLMGFNMGTIAILSGIALVAPKSRVGRKVRATFFTRRRKTRFSTQSPLGRVTFGLASKSLSALNH